METVTRGVWCWCVAHPAAGTDSYVLLLDTEGTEDATEVGQPAARGGGGRTTKHSTQTNKQSSCFVLSSKSKNFLFSIQLFQTEDCANIPNPHCERFPNRQVKLRTVKKREIKVPLLGLNSASWLSRDNVDNLKTGNLMSNQSCRTVDVFSAGGQAEGRRDWDSRLSGVRRARLQCAEDDRDEGPGLHRVSSVSQSSFLGHQRDSCSGEAFTLHSRTAEHNTDLILLRTFYLFELSRPQRSDYVNHYFLPRFDEKSPFRHKRVVCRR